MATRQYWAVKVFAKHLSYGVSKGNKFIGMHVGKHLFLWIQWGLKSIKALSAGLLGFRGGST